MVTGFGAGMGRAGAGLAKVGAGAAIGLGATILAARGAFRALMKLAPYSDGLATSLGKMINVNEELKKRVAEALVPAVDQLATSLQDAAPMIERAAVAMVEGVAEYLNRANELARPGSGGFFDGAVTALSGTWSRQFANNPAVADQTQREYLGDAMPYNTGIGSAISSFFRPSDTVLGPGEAGTDQLGVGASGGGNAGDFLRQIAANTAPQGEGF